MVTISQPPDFRLQSFSNFMDAMFRDHAARLERKKQQKAQESTFDVASFLGSGLSNAFITKEQQDANGFGTRFGMSALKLLPAVGTALGGSIGGPAGAAISVAAGAPSQVTSSILNEQARQSAAGIAQTAQSTRTSDILARNFGMTGAEFTGAAKSAGIPAPQLRQQLLQQQAEDEFRQKTQAKVAQQEALAKQKQRDEALDEFTELRPDKIAISQLENQRKSMQNQPLRPAKFAELDQQFDAEIERLTDPANFKRFPKLQKTPRERFDDETFEVDGVRYGGVRGFKVIDDNRPKPPPPPKPPDFGKAIAQARTELTGVGDPPTLQAIQQRAMQNLQAAAELEAAFAGGGAQLPPPPPPPGPEELRQLQHGQPGPPGPALSPLDQGREILQSIASQLPPDMPVSKWPKNAKRAGKKVAQQMLEALKAEFPDGNVPPELIPLMEMMTELLK